MPSRNPEPKTPKVPADWEAGRGSEDQRTRRALSRGPKINLGLKDELKEESAKELGVPALSVWKRPGTLPRAKRAPSSFGQTGQAQLVHPSERRPLAEKAAPETSRRRPESARSLPGLCSCPASRRLISPAAPHALGAGIPT